MKRKYIVYEHITPNNKRYIGITKQKPERRWQKGHGYADNPYFINAIKKYGWENIQNNILHTNLSKEKAIELEIEYIKKYRSNTREKGYNLTAGGEVVAKIGNNMGKYNPRAVAVLQIDMNTKEVIKRYESLADASRELGINHRGISKACKGKESYSYMGFLWEYADIDYKKPPRRPVGRTAESMWKSVNQMDMSGNVIATFKSIQEAAEKTNSNRSHISNVCNGKRKQHNGSRWSFAVLE